MQKCKKLVLKPEIHPWGVHRPVCGCQSCEKKADEYMDHFKKLLNQFKQTIEARNLLRKEG